MPKLPEGDGNQASVVQAHWKDRWHWFALSLVLLRTLAVLCDRKPRSLQKPQQKMVEAAGIETRMGVSRLCAKMREKARIHWSKCAFRALSSVVGNCTEAHENAEILSSIVINFSGADRPVLDPHAAWSPMAGF
jgi:hypothetical protein